MVEKRQGTQTARQRDEMTRSSTETAWNRRETDREVLFILNWNYREVK